jgi:hypothetical protein
LTDRVGALFEDTGVAWDGSVEDLLYEGESVERTVELADGWVVVTSHRLLASTPSAEGQNLRKVDRPNVVGVGMGHDGNRTLLERLARTTCSCPPAGRRRGPRNGCGRRCPATLPTA